MTKNKIVLVLMLGMILSPIYVLKAEDSTSVNTTGNIEVQKNNDIIKNSTEQRNAIKTTAKKYIDQKLGEIKTMRDETIANLKTNVEQRVTALKVNIAAKKSEVEKKIAAKKDEVKIKLATKAQDRVKKLLENIYGNLNGKITKLSEIDVKILAKINTAEINGTNVTAPKAQYVIAKASLDKAIVDVNATKAASIDQTSIKTSKDAIRLLVKTAEDSIKTAGAEYRKIIPLITPVISDTKVETETSSVNQ
jgi:hypothetical protein